VPTSEEFKNMTEEDFDKLTVPELLDHQHFLAWAIGHAKKPKSGLVAALASKPGDDTRDPGDLADLEARWNRLDRYLQHRLESRSNETGHYDDGHSFGWPTGAAGAPADAAVDQSNETGHRDDGHSFGWPTGAVGVPADAAVDQSTVTDPTTPIDGAMSAPLVPSRSDDEFAHPTTEAGGQPLAARVDDGRGEDALAEVTSSDGKGGKRRVAMWLAGGAAVVVATVAIVVAVSGGGTDTQDTKAASRPDAAAGTPSSSSTSLSPGTGPQLVSGSYAGAVKVAPGKDPAGHACCVKPTMRWDVRQTRDTSTGAITIALADVVDGVDLSGPLAATGSQFSATGSGTVAGYPNTSVEFDGTATPDQGLHGMLVVGATGTLPTGQSVTFQVDMQKSA